MPTSNDAVLLRLVGAAERVEAKIDALSERVGAVTGRMDGHEVRIRGLERFQWMNNGIAAAGGTIVGLLGIDRVMKLFGGS